MSVYVINNYNEDTFVEQERGLMGPDVNRNDVQWEISTVRLSAELICPPEITIGNFKQINIDNLCGCKSRAFNRPSYRFITYTKSNN